MAENKPRGLAESDDRDGARPLAPPGLDLVGQYVSENFRSGKYPFTPQGLADLIDDAVGRAVYEAIDGVAPGDIRAVGAGQTGETVTTAGWCDDHEIDRFHDDGGPVPPEADA